MGDPKRLDGRFCPCEGDEITGFFVSILCDGQGRYEVGAGEGGRMVIMKKRRGVFVGGCWCEC